VSAIRRQRLLPPTVNNQSREDELMYEEAINSGGNAVVTGGASGVGRVAAMRFAQAGLGVILADLPG